MYVSARQIYSYLILLRWGIHSYPHQKSWISPRTNSFYRPRISCQTMTINWVKISKCQSLNYFELSFSCLHILRFCDKLLWWWRHWEWKFLLVLQNYSHLTVFLMAKKLLTARGWRAKLIKWSNLPIPAPGNTF